MLRTLSAAIIGLTMLSACATTEPDPCSAEWVEWKTERIVNKFARQNFGELRRVKSFADNLKDGGMGPMQMMKLPQLMDEFTTLASSFNKTVLPELNLAVETCGSPQQFVPAFTSFLEDQGVEGEVLNWVTQITEVVMTMNEQTDAK